MPLFRWEAPGPYVVAFSTRRGGLSEGPFASLNLGRRLGDDPERVDENRRRLCTSVGADAERLATNYQVHSPRVNRAAPGRRGAPGDALWTDDPAVPLLALTADCLPIAVARTNGSGPALGVLHAGRIGLLAGVVAAGVAAVGSGGKTSAAIGPAIGPCCYEVGAQIRDAFRREYGRGVVTGSHIDLWTSAERALRRAGCESVERVDLCTACNRDLFFSYRRDGTPRGGQGVIGFVT